MEWRHVPTKHNPADLASRGGPTSSAKLWWEGPDWLSHHEQWPQNILSQPSEASETEAKVSKEIVACAVEQKDAFDEVLARFCLSKALRVCAWVSRFTRNSRRAQSQRISGPLTTEELNIQKNFWIKRAQKTHGREKDTLELNLKEDEEGILRCHGRVQGHYPVYIPDDHLYASKMVEDAHKRTLHGGVGMTMTLLREKYWIPRLRRLARRIVKSCHGCRRFRATALARPPTGNLPRDRTEGDRAFQVLGVDYACRAPVLQNQVQCTFKGVFGALRMQPYTSTSSRAHEDDGDSRVPTNNETTHCTQRKTRENIL